MACHTHSKVDQHFQYSDIQLRDWSWKTFQKRRGRQPYVQTSEKYKKSLETIKKACKNSCWTQVDREHANHRLSEFNAPVRIFQNSGNRLYSYLLFGIRCLTYLVHGVFHEPELWTLLTTFRPANVYDDNTTLMKLTTLRLQSTRPSTTFTRASRLSTSTLTMTAAFPREVIGLTSRLLELDVSEADLERLPAMKSMRMCTRRLQIRRCTRRLQIRIKKRI